MKSLQKPGAYLEPKQASRMELFCEYTSRLTIFAIKARSQMFDWVMYSPPKVLKLSKCSEGGTNHRDCYSAQRSLFITFLNGHLSEVSVIDLKYMTGLQINDKTARFLLSQSQTPSRSSHQSCSVKKGALKNL